MTSPSVSIQVGGEGTHDTLSETLFLFFLFSFLSFYSLCWPEGPAVLQDLTSDRVQGGLTAM